jgi:hypothetical protein
MDKSLRFDWFDTLKIQLLDDLSSKVALVIDLDKKTQNQSPEQLKNQKDKDLVAVYQLLSAMYQSYFMPPMGTHRLSIPTSPSAYSRRSDGALPLKFPFRSMQRVLKALQKMSWICIDAGNTFKGISRISITPHLAAVFRDEGLQWFPQEPRDPAELILLRDRVSARDKTKLELEVPPSYEVDRCRSFLLRYNAFLLQHCVALNVSDKQLEALSHDPNGVSINFFQLQLRRIFSRGSMTKGGRFYGGWWQGLPSVYRPNITIDGYRTTEIDYSSMAIRLIYASQGVTVPSDVDLYDIGLPDWQGSIDPRRKALKKFLNALLNDESGRFKLDSSELLLIGMSHDKLLKLMRRKYAEIEHLFNTGVGLDAQFVDSEIALNVMQRLMDEEILVLPIHDSFIVRNGNRAELQDAMHEAYFEVTRQATSIDETGPGTKETFGASLDKTDIDARCRAITLEEAFDSEIKMPSRLMHNFVASWRRYQCAGNTYKSSHTGP